MLNKTFGGQMTKCLKPHWEKKTSKTKDRIIKSEADSPKTESRGKYGVFMMLIDTLNKTEVETLMMY